MYLPQFHPIPENDTVWGKGFTEWTNVAKAKPLFRGHNQPHLPADLGFYDLRLPETREQQAELARNAGVEGFMYWHYWFGNGKRLLERPFNEVLENGKPDYPFCLGWANHSWKTSSWITGKEFRGDSLIMEQLYPGEKDWILHFNTLLPAFKDKRYIRVEDKPLFVIYAPQDVPDIDKYMDCWNKMAQSNGLKGIYFVGLYYGRECEVSSWEKFNLDAICVCNINDAEVNVNGHYKRAIIHRLRKILHNVIVDKYDYAKLIKYLVAKSCKKINYFPCIMPGWDRTPRSKNATVWTNNTPKLFQKHVEEAVKIVQHKDYDKRLIFLRSWNEWGEGNYVEPDLQYGHGYLDAISEANKDDSL